MSVGGRRPWGWWNGRDMLPLEVRLAALPPEPKVRSARKRGPRGTEDKTGQGTRTKIKRQLLHRWGPYCHLCVIWGVGLDRARIDLMLPFPHPQCFTRDHVQPRSLKGAVFAVVNQRPAHNRCNTHRGNMTMDEVINNPPVWATQALARTEEAA